MSDADVAALTGELLAGDVFLALAFVGIVAFSVRRWGRKGWWAAISAIPLGVIWVIAGVLLAFAGPWCSKGC
jgi:uncharacterized membrane protein YeiB